MKSLSKRAHVALALSLPAVLAAATAIVACSSSDSSTSASGATSCADQTLTVSFNPMYSAYIEGDSQQTFQVPAVVDGVASSAVKWNVADSSIADLATDPDTGGVMLTIKKAGSTTVVASAGTLCGSAPLTVTSSTQADWTTGNDRYNNGVSLVFGRGPGDGPPDGGTDVDGGNGKTPQCTSCHGASATTGPFKTVQHTPEQTAGFSDDDLKSIFRNGTVPDGGYFDDSIVPYDAWQHFHTWSMTDDEATGIVVYLRALTPAPQTGASNFGGRQPDGGRPFHGDGGAPPTGQ